jgi:hypothetical protein
VIGKLFDSTPGVDHRVGYQVAKDLAIHEQHALWERSSVMILANSALIASAGLSLREPIKLLNTVPLAFVISIVGVILCFVWIFLAARTFIKTVYWTQKATELEDKLDDSVETLARANLWGNGKLSKQQCKEILGKNFPILRPLSNVIRVKTAPLCIAVIFLIMQLLMLVASVW